MELRGGQLAYNIWIKLPEEVRHKLVVLFDIPRSGRTVVEYRASGPVVTSDGYTPEDIMAITLDKMQGILGSTSDNFYSLFEEVANHLDELMGGTYNAAPAATTEVAKKRFCDLCDSKAIKHRKICPNYRKNG